MLIWNNKNLNNSIYYHNDKSDYQMLLELVEYKKNRNWILSVKLSSKEKLGLVFQFKKGLCNFLDNYYEKLMNFLNKNFKFNQYIAITNLDEFSEFFNDIKWFISFWKNGKHIVKNNQIELVVMNNNDYVNFVNRKNDYE